MLSFEFVNPNAALIISTHFKEMLGYKETQPSLIQPRLASQIWKDVYILLCIYRSQQTLNMYIKSNLHYPLRIYQGPKVLSIGAGTGHEVCNDEEYIWTEARGGGGEGGAGNSSYTPVPGVEIKYPQV